MQEIFRRHGNRGAVRNLVQNWRSILASSNDRDFMLFKPSRRLACGRAGEPVESGCEDLSVPSFHHIHPHRRVLREDGVLATKASARMSGGNSHPYS
ncbi:hypothetical protein Nepgr_033770 [Nepenthes gracilis]|uniref:Uncharacterized protein n=1 Tax=Nepenthes gracilis TaxID=150966 RepID=A0AAD3TMJ9_NEPGR|nr:hypothetical protein Nepgr_033770 [Nepenthes gracilis]